MIIIIHKKSVKSRENPLFAIDRMVGFFVNVARLLRLWPRTPGALLDSPGRWEEGESIIKNCLFYVAYSRELRGRLLQRQARDLLILITNSELLPSDRIRLCLADDNLSDQKDFIQRQGEVRL